MKASDKSTEFFAQAVALLVAVYGCTQKKSRVLALLRQTAFRSRGYGQGVQAEALDQVIALVDAEPELQGAIAKAEALILSDDHRSR